MKLSWSKILGRLYRFHKKTRVRTVRQAFSLGSVALAALVATTLLSDTGTYIRLVASEVLVDAGEEFTVSVYVGAQESVNAVDIAVQFPADVVDVTGIDIGRSVISIWAQDPFIEGDTVVLQGGTFRRGFIGEHLVAEINFVAAVSGRADFSVQEQTLLAGDGSGTEISSITTEAVRVVAMSTDGTVEGEVALVFVTDIDGNGVINFRDIEGFMSAWREKRWIYDFNNDGQMNFTDFAILLADAFFN